MGRKVMISFLGVADYSKILYTFNSGLKEKKREVIYVQEAIIDFFCQDFKNGKDKVFIFSTKQAFDKHWENLQKAIQRVNDTVYVQKKVVVVEDIWNTISSIVEVVELEDELIFDVTHSFRTLPMLSMVLMPYLRTTKKISIRGIYYGAYEARKEGEKGFSAPIWNLNALVDLQTWSTNIEFFLKSGNAFLLSEQISKESSYKKLADLLSTFSKYIQAAQGKEIYRGDVMVEIRKELSKIYSNSFDKRRTSIAPENTMLSPLLEELKNVFSLYEKNSIYNGFLAVHWCISKGLVPQAAILLYESFVSWVMFTFLDLSQDEVFNKSQRGWEKVKQKLKGKEYYENICSLRDKVKVRHEISHGGFINTPRSFEDIVREVQNSYDKVRIFVKKISSKKLPTLK